MNYYLILFVSREEWGMAESEELESLLMKVKEESEKNWLKTQHSEN